MPSRTRYASAVLFCLLIACGGKAGFLFSWSPIPATHILFFALCGGAILGSGLGAGAAGLYLGVCLVAPSLMPTGSGPTLFEGPLAGQLLSLPAAAYLSGRIVEIRKMESPVNFAVGACCGVAVFDAFSTFGLMGSARIGPVEGFVMGAGGFLGLQIVQGALCVFTATSLSNLLHFRERE